jgi:hypothetical protein
MFVKDYGKNKESFLLIIRDEYLKTSNIYCDHLDEILFSFKDCHSNKYNTKINREKLLEYFLVKQLCSTKKTNVISLDIEINSIESLDFSKQNIKEIEPNTFQGFMVTVI